MRRIVSFISFILAASLLCAPAVALAQNTSGLATTDVVRVTRVDANGNGTPGAVNITKLFDGIGVGYFSGAAITQGTNRTTGVTINSHAGQITLFTAAGSATPASFTVTNSKVGANDTIVLSVKSSTTNLYEVFVTAVAAGSFQITFFTTGGTTSDAPVITFAVVRSAAS
jgi:hypothetical protein